MLKILIVENEDSIHTVTQEAFRNLLGYQVYTAIKGEEAINFFKTKEIDLVILNDELFDMTGFEVVRRMREQGFNPIVIILTGFFDDKVQDRAVELDLKYVMMKPVSLLALNEKIKELFPEQAKDFPKGIFDFE